VWSEKNVWIFDSVHETQASSGCKTIRNCQIIFLVFSAERAHCASADWSTSWGMLSLLDYVPIMFQLCSNCVPQVFMYIIPSALLSILQNYLLHQPNFRKRFGLFVAPTPANPNPTSSKPSL
jgi:hypothetical protein